MAEIAPHAAVPPYTREAAWQLVCEYTESPSLRKHALSVETCVRAYGEREADALDSPEKIAPPSSRSTRSQRVLHDFDYERFPSLDDHPFAGNKILAELGWPEEVRTAILSHASYSGVPRNSHLEKALFACDELAGFLTACALVKPTKSISRRRGGRSSQEDEGQGLRQRSSPRRHRERSGRARRRPRSAHRVLSGGDAEERGRVGTRWNQDSGDCALNQTTCPLLICLFSAL